MKKVEEKYFCEICGNKMGYWDFTKDFVLPMRTCSFYELDGQFKIRPAYTIIEDGHMCNNCLTHFFKWVDDMREIIPCDSKEFEPRI